MALFKRKYTAVAAVLSLATCFAMSGCGSDGAEAVELDLPCSFNAQITKGEQSFEVSFQRDSESGWTAVFASPDSLSDMTVRSFGESCAIDHQGIMLEMPADKMPVGSVTSAIESCIDHAARSSSAKFVKDGDDKLVKGETSCGQYELKINDEGELISLYIGTEICAEFSEFERLS